MTVRLKLVGQVLALALVAGLLALLVWKLVAQDSGAADRLRQGKRVQAPQFTLPRLDGRGELSLASLRGKVVVLNFWQSTCPPCKSEAPVFERAWRDYRDEGVVFVGVDFWDLKSSARAFVRRHGVTYPQVYDGRGDLLGRYGIVAPPETFVVARDGRLVAHIRGEAPSEQLRRYIDAALQV